MCPHNYSLTLSALLCVPALLGACQTESIDSILQSSIGGMPATDKPHYDAVAAITILLPPANVETPGAASDEQSCTGVLISDRVVMTAASCVLENWKADDEPHHESYAFLGPEFIHVQFGANPSGSKQYALDSNLNTIITRKGVTFHRDFNVDSPGLFDIALLTLSESTNILPVVLNANALDNAWLGEPIEIVGFGKDESGDPLFGLSNRKFIEPTIDAVSNNRISAGSDDAKTCFADSGGPGFLSFTEGDSEVIKLVSVSSLHNTTSCSLNTKRQRIDIFVSSFLAPFIKYSEGCLGCDDCELNGICKEDCPTRDADCALGVATGQSCTQSGDCESGGACIPATDDPANLYCAKPCDSDNNCPQNMVCGMNSQCIYDGISPGSQGAQCGVTSDCRSGFCEGNICANACEIGGNSCDTDNGFFCLASTQDANTTVCRKNVSSGGGGFCSVGERGDSSARDTFLLLLAILFFIRCRKRTTALSHRHR